MHWPELRHAPGDLVGDPDEYARWFASVEDQLLEAEERYRTLVETLPLATYIDRDDRTVGTAWVSSQIETITSYAPAEWTSNPDLLIEVLHPEDRDEVLAEMQRVKESGGSRDHEYRLVRRDGSVVWVHDSAVSVVEGERRYARGFVVDVTARREAELELERQNQQLRQLDRLKDEFVALVSHELRTPLTSIRGYLELMSEDENLTPEQLRFLDTIDRNAQRLQRVVGDLLFCAQVEAGKLRLESGRVELNAVVEEALHAAQPAATAKSIELNSELGALPEIEGDRARLAQVLDNFLSNAIKFTPTGGSVTVTTIAYPGEVEIAIADTGMGIAAAELPNLFRRFFRTERATASAVPGTGLGLAIAKAIVTEHGGRIRVQSTEGAGTTFRVILPG
ncbi:MAG: PAS domain-containing protein [Thermoleophilia bacterium]|nr:PAS domain-containing protein [Thermoleophilia bacterium]